MLEFLRECDTGNMYARASDCELKLNAFDCYTPFAEFFEVTLKAMSARFFPDQAETDRNLSTLLKQKELTGRICAEYGFDDFGTINEIRLKSNAMKHERHALPGREAEKKKFFRCLFDFAACYYHAHTGLEKPDWSEEKYDCLIVDEHARETREKKLRGLIGELEAELDGVRRERVECSRRIERLEAELRETRFARVPRESMDRLREAIRETEDRDVAADLEMLRVERRIRALERERHNADEDENGVPEANAPGEGQAARPDTRDRASGEPGSELKRLYEEKERLIAKANAIREEHKGRVTDLENAADATADEEAVNRLSELLRSEIAKREDAEKRLRSVQERFAEAQKSLHATNTELDRIRDAYFARREEAEKWAEQHSRAVSEMQSLSDRLPRCVKCNSLLTVSEKNGSIFWRCPAWRPNGQGCDSRTRPVNEAERALAEQVLELERRKRETWKRKQEAEQQPDLTVPEEISGRYRSPGTEYVAYPASLSGTDRVAYLFETLAVPPELFGQREYRGLLRKFSRFMVMSGLEKRDVPDEERTLYTLALRMLNRGAVLPLRHRVLDLLRQRFQKRSFGRVNSLFEYIRYDRSENAYDSEREERFANEWLCGALGPCWATWTITQAGIDMIVPGRAADFKGERVDFLIRKNGRCIAVELDGPEHGGRLEADRQRDNVLTQNGCTVLRFRNEDVDRHAPEIAERLRAAIGPDRRTEFNTELDDRYIVACKLQHQFTVCIMKALEQGMIGRHANLSASVSTDMFTEAETRYILMLAAEEARDLIERFAALYGVKTDVDLSDESCPPITVFVGDGDPAGRAHLLIRDCVWQYDALCELEDFSGNALPRDCGERELKFFLEYTFGFGSFREGQTEAIGRLLRRQDSVVLLPTGAGKSVIYQLASFLMPGMTVVISPLRSLMDDQLDNMELRDGITSAVAIKSESTREGRSRQETAFRLIRHSSTALMYIAPERLQIPSFRQCVRDMSEHNRVAAVAIDEAHCVSEWGHDFRPAYLNIVNSVRTLFGKGGEVPALIALTGTASMHVLRDVQASLGITEDGSVVMPATFDRPELHFSVIHCASRDKSLVMAQLLRGTIPARLGVSYDKLAAPDGDNVMSGIVFTPLGSRRKPSQYDALSVSRVLECSLPEMGVGCYFSSKPLGYDEETWSAAIREKASQFKNDDISLLVATKAFGMGIDKKNVRYVLHDGIAASLEEYYQEAGRAGRGGDSSQCVLIFSDDRAETNEPLLDPDLPLPEMRDRFAGLGKTGMTDDLSAILYFHTSSFAGVEEECGVARDVLTRLTADGFEPGAVRVLTLDREPGSAVSKEERARKWMQALMRLIVLGAVRDYTYDYIGRFEAVCGSMAAEDVTAGYVRYVTAENPQRAAEARAAMANVRGTGAEFVLGAVRVLTEHIYDGVEKSRRAAVRLMYTTAKKAAALPADEQDAFIRGALMDYFYEGDRSAKIQRLLTMPDAGLAGVISCLPEGLKSGRWQDTEDRRLGEIVMQAGRLLESMPDQPALLMLRALCEPEDYAKSGIEKDFAAAMRFAKERYSVRDGVLYREAGRILDLIFGVSPDAFAAVLGALDGRDRRGLLQSMIDDDAVNDAHRETLLMLCLAETIEAKTSETTETMGTMSTMGTMGTMGTIKAEPTEAKNNKHGNNKRKSSGR